MLQDIFTPWKDKRPQNLHERRAWDYWQHVLMQGTDKSVHWHSGWWIAQIKRGWQRNVVAWTSLKWSRIKCIMDTARYIICWNVWEIAANSACVVNIKLSHLLDFSNKSTSTVDRCHASLRHRSPLLQKFHLGNWVKLWTLVQYASFRVPSPFMYMLYKISPRWYPYPFWQLPDNRFSWGLHRKRLAPTVYKVKSSLPWASRFSCK